MQRLSGAFAVVLFFSIPETADAAWIHGWPAEGNPNDSVGTADGTELGGVTYTTDGFIGQGFVLDGVDDGVDFGTEAGNFGATDFTVAFAIRTDAVGTIRQLLSKRGQCAFSVFWDIRMDVTGVLGFEVRAPTENLGTSTGIPVDDGEWHTVVFMREGNTVSAWVDGILRESNTTTGEVADISNEAPLRLGDGSCLGLDGTVRMQGMVDEIRIADHAEPYLLLGDFECGDAALNGGVTAADALTTLRASVGTSRCPACACDVNRNGAITAPDALAILRFAVGLAEPLDCPECEF